jgi:prepilin-type N-terminal cleavage/methylation domain-containing protein
LKTNKTKQGFTLVEVLIAVSILAVTLTAMATLVIVTMRANTANMNSLQAYYLSEQGIEAMRNIRDSNWMQNYGWNGGDDLWGDSFECDALNMTRYFTVDENETVSASFSRFNLSPVLVLPDYVVAAFPSVPDAPWDLVEIASVPSDAAKLYSVVDEGGYTKFTHDTGAGSETIFSRYIQISYTDCDQDIAEVSSVVTWNERGNEKSLVLSTYLTNWQK